MLLCSCSLVGRWLTNKADLGAFSTARSRNALLSCERILQSSGKPNRELVKSIKSLSVEKKGHFEILRKN